MLLGNYSRLLLKQGQKEISLKEQQISLEGLRDLKVPFKEPLYLNCKVDSNQFVDSIE